MRNSLCCKVKGHYYDFWHKLDYFKLRDVPGFLSAGHIHVHTHLTVHYKRDTNCSYMKEA